MSCVYTGTLVIPCLLVYNSTLFCEINKFAYMPGRVVVRAVGGGVGPSPLSVALTAGTYTSYKLQHIQAISRIILHAVFLDYVRVSVPQPVLLLFELAKNTYGL